MRRWIAFDAGELGREEARICSTAFATPNKTGTEVLFKRSSEEDEDEEDEEVPNAGGDGDDRGVRLRSGNGL